MDIERRMKKTRPWYKNVYFQLYQGWGYGWLTIFNLDTHKGFAHGLLTLLGLISLAVTADDRAVPVWTLVMLQTLLTYWISTNY